MATHFIHRKGSGDDGEEFPDLAVIHYPKDKPSETLNIDSFRRYPLSSFASAERGSDAPTASFTSESSPSTRKPSEWDDTGDIPMVLTPPKRPPIPDGMENIEDGDINSPYKSADGRSQTVEDSGNDYVASFKPQSDDEEEIIEDDESEETEDEEYEEYEEDGEIEVTEDDDDQEVEEVEEVEEEKEEKEEEAVQRVDNAEKVDNASRDSGDEEEIPTDEDSTKQTERGSGPRGAETQTPGGWPIPAQTQTPIDSDGWKPDRIMAPTSTSQPIPQRGSPRAPRKKNALRDFCATAIIIWILIFLGVAVIVVGLVNRFVLQDDDTDNVTYQPGPRDQNDQTSDNDMGPSLDDPISITPMDAFQPGNCNFSNRQQPHVIDQCACNGEIRIVAPDVRERYDLHRELLIPTMYSEFGDMRSCSPPNQALVWLSTANDADFDDVERRQRFALATIFIGLSGETWNDNSKWLSTSSSCEWSGIECSDDGTVLFVSLESRNAQGMLPREISFLEDLVYLSLQKNNVGGSIPFEMFGLRDLKVVDLSFNAIGGAIPSFVSLALELEYLNLEHNSLTGEIPSEIGETITLQSLRLASNLLQGGVPESLFDLPDLQELDIQENELDGILPSTIGNALKLTSLTLGPNQFTGAVREEISALTNLEKLSMKGIDISGRLPGSFGLELTNLQELIISDTYVSGTIPPFFGGLSSLTLLDLSGNLLRGAIPGELGALTMLSKLYMDNNELSGQIPGQLGQLESLSELLLNDNKLTGVVPDTFSQLSLLEVLRLEGNLLTGRVSEEVCSLRQGILEEFIVDCPSSLEGEVNGVACGVPTCCSDCLSSS